MKNTKGCFVLLLVYIANSVSAQSIVNKACTDSIKLETVYDSLLFFAQKYVGVKYKYQGTSKQGFDCSGFVQFVFNEYNKKLPHSSSAQSLIGKEVQLNDLQKGDLVFFKGRSLKSKKVGHVGIVIESNNGHFKMIHASVQKGVTIDLYPEANYYRKRYLTARRIVF